jgi:hypothetical protein
VDRKLTECHSHSPTGHLDQAYADSETSLRGVEEQLQRPEGASGVVFAYAGQIVGFDLFDKPGTLCKLWHKLVRAYAIDALMTPSEQKVTLDQVRAFLLGARQAKEEMFKSPGLGQDVRMEGPTLIGAGLIIEDHPVHVEVFANAMGA